MKIVLTYGTFDLFHVGHVRLLKRLKALGDKLIVGLSTDEFNTIKGKQSFYSYEERREILLSCRYVDDVFAENEWEQKTQDIIKFNANILGMGSDWEGKFNHLQTEQCKVVYLPRTQEISTTDIKKKLALITPEEIEKIENTLNCALEIISAIGYKDGYRKE